MWRLHNVDHSMNNECGTVGGMRTGKENRNALSSAILFITNPTCLDLGWNPGHRSGKPATVCLSFGTVQ
jgi:hypothetical protein